ncbi:MAG: hypothetical protein JW388_0439 [Nitrospira sp.]|nr:hypothetical protein [Nitrospira sp.]
MEQENDVRQRYEQDLLNQRVFERSNCAIDQLAAIVKWFDGNARRKTRCDGSDLFFHAPDDVHCILTGAHHHGAADHFTTTEIQRTTPKLSADLHCGDFAQVNRRAVAFHEYRQLQFLHRPHQPESAHYKFHPIFFDRFSADVQVALANGIHHLLQRHARRSHLQ